MESEEVENNLEGDDTIYHYTSMEKALHYILDQGCLKLFPRKNMVDPLENRDISIVSNISIEDASEELNTLRTAILERSQKVKQICFSMNDNTLNRFVNFEYFGVAKPRMWDNYADNYKGVCLVFSKSKLLTAGDNLKASEIQYKKYNSLSQKSIFLNHSRYEEIGFEAYKEELIERVDDFLFWKHHDYSGENECRIISFASNEEYLKINGALKAIFVSWHYNHTSNSDRNSLAEYAKRYNADLKYINWSANEIDFLTPELANQFLKSAQDLLKRTS